MLNELTEAAKKIGSLPVGSLITGADYHHESNTLALTGYGKNKIQYLYVINNFTLSTISSASINQYDLHLNAAQVEAVAILDPNIQLQTRIAFNVEPPGIKSGLKLSIKSFVIPA